MGVCDSTFLEKESVTQNVNEMMHVASVLHVSPFGSPILTSLSHFHFVPSPNSNRLDPC